MKHSPLPWRIEIGGEYEDFEDSWKMVDANGDTVFDCTFVHYEGGGSPPSEEDAEFILWAVNTYAERLESFKEI